MSTMQDVLNHSKEPEMAFSAVPSVKYANERKDDLDKINAPLFDSHCYMESVIGPRRYFYAESPMRFLKKYYAEHYEGDFLEGCITSFCNPNGWDMIVEGLQRVLSHDGIYSAFGVHPKYADIYSRDKKKVLRKILHHPRVVALGDIGLDSKQRRRCPSTQIDVFRDLINLSLEFRKPIVLHLRGDDAFLRGFQIFREKVPPYWPIHLTCFQEGWKLCCKWLNSFPNLKVGLCPNSYNLDTVLNIPLNRLLLETKAPFILPVVFSSEEQYTGQGSHPAMVFQIAQQVANIKKKPLKTVLQSNRINIEQVYSIEWKSDVAASARDDFKL